MKPWRAGTTALYAGVDFIPQSGIYEFGYRILIRPFQNKGCKFLGTVVHHQSMKISAT
jgi:hypothetical protein